MVLMPDDPVRLERVDRAHIVRLDRAENLFDEAFVASFHAALDAVAGANDVDGETLPVVTIGAGKSYSNGFDLEYLGSLQGESLWAFVARSCALLGRILTFPAPTVAAVNGHAFGIGGILALAHDLRVMRADRGWFCLPEVDLGLAFHPFMHALIAARLPGASAQEAILTGRRYDGAAALDAGIVHATAGEAQLVARALELAQPYTGKRAPVLAALKAQLHGTIVTTLPT
jgi:enoyl-CoA hydratase/carnithine racemase